MFGDEVDGGDGGSESGHRPLALLLTVAAIVYWLVILWYAVDQMIPRSQFTVLFLGGAIIIYAFDEAIDAYDDGDYVDVWLLSIIAVTTLAITVYMYRNFDTLYFVRLGYALGHEYILGLLFILIVGYLTLRAFGMAFFSVLLLSVTYGFAGPYMPGLFAHGGYSLPRTIDILVWSFDGFFGFITRIIAAWVSLFILYAGLLQGYGAFSLFVRVSFKISEYVKSGVAQSAVIASMLIGSINGAPTANAAMTGSITIPIMRESGIRSDSAGGIESVASTGGQIMPPIMGAGAFLMASFLDIPYVDVLIAGLLPALIFYISVVFAVHYTAVSQITDADQDPEEHFDTERSGLLLSLDAVKFAVPFLILIYLLGIARWTIMTSALYTVIAMLVMGITVPLVEEAIAGDRLLPAELKTQLANTVRGFKIAAIIMAPIAIVVAAINGIVDILVRTGVPGTFTLALMEVSGGILFIALLVAMAICILLGLGMPTAAAYTLVAVLIAPGLINAFELAELPVHFFVFYSAILAGLTPPIAVVVVVAAGVAGSDFFKTCIEAVKISFPLFVLPIAFVYNPEIITDPASLTAAMTTILIMTGAIFISYGANANTITSQHVLRYVDTRWISRATYIVGGSIVMIHPGQTIRLGVITVLTLIFLLRDTNRLTHLWKA